MKALMIFFFLNHHTVPRTSEELLKAAFIVPRTDCAREPNHMRVPLKARFLRLPLLCFLVSFLLRLFVVSGLRPVKPSQS